MSLESEIGDGDAKGDGKSSLSELAKVVRVLSGSQAVSDSDIERNDRTGQRRQRIYRSLEFTAFHGVDGVTTEGSEKELNE